MSTPEDLKGLYTDELKDLWSANDQMQRVLKEIAPKTSDPSLKEMLGKSVEGILKHTELLKELLAGQDEKVSKEHCRGMEGLVAEATKHVLEDRTHERRHEHQTSRRDRCERKAHQPLHDSGSGQRLSVVRTFGTTRGVD